jgi:pimeloyl-ACP methyl ester carboxylesterase
MNPPFKPSRPWMIVLLISALLAGVPASARAVEKVLTIPLRNGYLDTDDLTGDVRDSIGLANCTWLHGTLDLRGIRGSLFIQALNASLGDGGNVSLSDDDAELRIRMDRDRLPHDIRHTKAAARTFTAVANPRATADQERTYGLSLPTAFVGDGSRPLVVLIHGLDCNRANWQPMAEMLEFSGYQVAYFTYPSDQPLMDSTRRLTAQMQALRQMFPSMPVHLVAHSMGCLVARAFVEGPDYPAIGGIDSLILLAPPNHGSKWARFRLALEVEEHYHLWRTDPNWQPSWMITDGLGEAGRDLRKGSAFLQWLNDRPRRSGVRYTIIIGDCHPGWRMTANCVDSAANWVPRQARSWWGLRQCRGALKSAADDLRNKTSDNDGPVTLASARLDGVSDFVVVPADHTSLYIPVEEDHRPPSWDIVLDRLSRP